MPEDSFVRDAGRLSAALLVALAVGTLRPVGAAELESEAPAARSRTPLVESLGPPKPVQVVPVQVPRATDGRPARIAPPPSRYSGDERYRGCLDASDGTNLAWGECGGALIAREDQRMNEAWKRVYALDSEAKSPELLAEQRAWLAFRDASCLLYQSGKFGREGQVLSFPVCRAGIIAERTAALEAYGDPERR